MGDTNQIDKLLRHGADLELLAECWKPTMFDDFSPGTTPLQLAATSASLPAVQMLVERGAQVDKAIFRVPQGKDGDLVAGFLQTHGSKPVPPHRGVRERCVRGARVRRGSSLVRVRVRSV